MRSFNEYLSQRKWTRTTLTLWVGGALAWGVFMWSDGSVKAAAFIAMAGCWGFYVANVLIGYRAWKRESE